MQSCSLVFVLVNNKHMHIHALNTKPLDYREYVPFKRNYVKTKRLEAGILIKIKMIK